MASVNLVRVAARSYSTPVRRLATAAPCRASLRPALLAPSAAYPTLSASFSTSPARSSGPHEEETFDEFTARYEKEFEAVQDVFDLQRNLNNSFAYDLVPSTSVVVAALKAARRVNDFPTAVRIFEGIKAKVENKAQYEQYLEELEPLRKELGIELRENLYPDLGDRV